MRLQQLFYSFLSLFKRKQLKIGLYGLPNSGKTTLANRICTDWLGDVMGAVSGIEHETRQLQTKEKVIIRNKAGKKLSFNLIDTPGLATKIDYRNFVRAGLSEEEAKRRAREATKGVVAAVQSLATMDVVLVVFDSTKDPEDQVNQLLLENLASRGTPVLLVANKVDLRGANSELIRQVYPTIPLVAVSAKLGKNIDLLYESMYSLAK